MEIGISYSVTQNWPKMEWVATAFERLGHTVRRIHEREQLVPALQECDLAVFAMKSIGGRWPNVEQALKSRTCPVAYWWFDLVATEPGVPIRNQPIFQSFRRMFQASDLVLVKEHGCLDEYRSEGVNAFYLDQGVLSDFPEALPEPKEWDVLLWGQSNNYYHQRNRAVQALLDAGFSVAWASDSGSLPKGVVRLPWTPAMELHRLAAKARCVLSVGRRNDVEGYVSDAFWMAVGMGSCVVRQKTPGIPDGPYLTYGNHTELVDSVLWVKAHPHLVEDEGRRARAWALTEHSLEKRAGDLIRLAKTVTEKGLSITAQPAGS